MMGLISGNLWVGRQVRLTALRNEDVLMFAAWYEDAEFVRLYDSSTAYPRSLPNVRQQFDEDDKSNTTYAFGIRLMHADELIGMCALDSIMWNNRSAWLSIGIGDPAHRGQGYGGEALDILLRFGFYELNLHRIQLTVFDYNVSARHLYERRGFVREGLWREAILRDGQAFDQIHYSMLSHEYAARMAGARPDATE